MAKFFALLMLALAFFVGCAVAAPQFGFGGRPGGFGGRPGGFGNNFGGGFRPGQFFQPSTAGGFGNGQAGGGTAIGTGTGIANTGPNGFGVGLGVGGAINTPFGSQTFGQGTAAAVNGK